MPYIHDDHGVLHTIRALILQICIAVKERRHVGGVCRHARYNPNISITLLSGHFVRCRVSAKDLKMLQVLFLQRYGCKDSLENQQQRDFIKGHCRAIEFSK